MNVDFSRSITDLDGNPIKPQEGKDDVLLLSTLCVNALLVPRQTDAQLTGEDKLRRFLLAQSIHQANAPLDVKAEDIALLKILIADSNTTLLSAKASLLLDQS